MKLFKQTQHITNAHLLRYPNHEYFPIRVEGEWINRDEFIELKMEEYSLRTRGPVLRALQTIGY